MLALDVGSKKIGVAVCDDTLTIASPKTIISRDKFELEKIKQLIEETKACAIVIGLPLELDDSDNAVTKMVRKFAVGLKKYLEEEILFFFADERFSSFEAREYARSDLSKKSRQAIDDIAASVILNDFISLIKMKL